MVDVFIGAKCKQNIDNRICINSITKKNTLYNTIVLKTCIAGIPNISNLTARDPLSGQFARTIKTAITLNLI